MSQRYSLDATEKRRKKNYQLWKTSAQEKHGDSFGYHRSESNFVKQKSPEVEIYCRKHQNYFWVKPVSHVLFQSGG